MTKKESQELGELESLLRHRKGTEKGQRDLLARLLVWRQDLKRLLDKVTGWLGDLIEQELVSLEQREVDLQEEGIGPYKAPALTIRTPGNRLVGIEPVAMSIVSADGRVDLICMPKRQMILRFKPGDWHFIRPSPRPLEWQSDPVTRESFLREFRRMIE